MHRSTISREIRRNSGLRGYRHAQTHRLMKTRREVAVTKRISDEGWRGVAELIRFDLSPEQAAVRPYQERRLKISPEWIYRFIYADKARGGDLHKHLRGQKPYRKRYAGGRDRRGQLKGRDLCTTPTVSISIPVPSRRPVPQPCFRQDAPRLRDHGVNGQPW